MKEMLPSGQPCGGGLVGDDEEQLERELPERMAKPQCGEKVEGEDYKGAEGV